MNSQSIIPLIDGSVRFHNLTIKPYPRFELTGDMDACSQAVFELLQSEEVFAVIWRGKIRSSVLKALHRYEARHTGVALLLAQANPFRFADWTDWCPALIEILLQWTSDPIDGWQLTPQEVLSLFTNRWQDLLAAANMPPTKAFLRLLTRIPCGEASFNNLTLLKKATSLPRKAKLASHLDVINSSVIDAMQLPDRYLSIDLLRRAGVEPLPPGIESVRQLCLDIVDCRIQGIDQINWPFQGQKMSLARLAAYLEKQQRKLMNLEKSADFSIPPPPIPGYVSSDFEVHPLSTIGAIFTEASTMQNCLSCYAKQIATGGYYAYKLVRPERATLLVSQSHGLWVPLQMRTYKNGNPKPESIEAIESWMGEKYKWEDALDEPF